MLQIPIHHLYIPQILLTSLYRHRHTFRNLLNSELSFPNFAISLESVTSLDVSTTKFVYGSRGGSESVDIYVGEIDGDEILHIDGLKFCNSGGNSV